MLTSFLVSCSRHVTISNVLAEYEQLISDSSLDIQRHLHEIDRQYADSLELKEERESTERSLEMITKTLHYIENDWSRLELRRREEISQLRSRQEDKLIEAGHFTALRGNLWKQMALLKSRLQKLEIKLNSHPFPNTAELEGNSEKRNDAQSLSISDKPSNSVFEDVVAAENAVQIITGLPTRRITTSSMSILGQMSDETLALFKRDSPSVTEDGDTFDRRTVITEYDPSRTYQRKYDGGDISSINSDGDSMFSYGTNETSATSVAGDAKDLLVKHFVDDHELKNLVVSALARMPSEKFMRNFRRLLKEFSKSLRSSAKSTLEREAALMVRRQRYYLSRAVIQQLGGQFGNQSLDGQKQLKRRGKVEKWLRSLSEDISQSKGMLKELESEQSGSEDSSDASGCEVNLKEVEYFILKTEDFKILKLNLQSFIYPSVRSNVMATEPTPNNTSEISVETPGVTEIRRKKSRFFSETKSNDKTLVAEAPALTQVWRRPCSIGRSLVRLMYRPLGLFENFLRPEIPHGHLRVSWICVCYIISV
jgi:hypothetical protein